MGRPFNFFGFIKPPFILQGAFLFKDEYSLNFLFSGELSGLFRENYNLGNFFSGDYTQDQDPDIYKLGLSIKRNEDEDTQSGVFLESSSIGNDFSGEYSGAFVENCSLLIDCTGTYSEEKLEITKFGADISGNLTPALLEASYLGSAITGVAIRDLIDEKAFLGNDLISGILAAPAGEARKEDKISLGTSFKGIYSAVPEEE